MKVAGAFVKPKGMTKVDLSDNLLGILTSSANLKTRLKCHSKKNSKLLRFLTQSTEVPKLP